MKLNTLLNKDQLLDKIEMILKNSSKYPKLRANKIINDNEQVEYIHSYYFLSEDKTLEIDKIYIVPRIVIEKNVEMEEVNWEELNVHYNVKEVSKYNSRK